MALKRKIDNSRDTLLGREPRPKRRASNVASWDKSDPYFDVLEERNPPVCRSGFNYTAASLTPWMNQVKQPWRTLGTEGVACSFPLANMVSIVQDLIDPDFDPFVLTRDDEPRYLKPLPSRISQEDIDFLKERGALTIPDKELRNELLRNYVQWSYSFMPTIDLHEFLRCIVENDPNGNISLLLFQAVMFAGTAFIDLEYLQAAGYQTRQSARKEFFSRVRNLYAFDYEDDRIAVIQTLLLMTYWADYESSPQKDIWHWIGVCNAQAQSIGLHKDPTQSDIDPQMQRLRIRLWWSLYSRDRLIAMALRRPTQINEGVCDVPMLSLNDCEIRLFHPSVMEALQCPQLQNIEHQRRLAMMFIEKVKLCQCLGRVLFAQYSPSNHQFGATTKTTITLVPRKASEAELNRCSQQLDRWLSALPKDAQFIPASKDNIREGENVLLLHSAMLRMVYHATSSALHRPRALIFADQDRAKGVQGPKTARTKLEDAATSITHIVQGLSQLNLVKFLPPSGVTVLLPATLAHLANLTSTNPGVRQTSTYNFRRCIEVLHGLKEMYPAADMEAARIEAAVKVQCMKLKASISITCNNGKNHDGMDRQTASTILSELLAYSSDSSEDDDFVEEIPQGPTPIAHVGNVDDDAGYFKESLLSCNDVIAVQVNHQGENNLPSSFKHTHQDSIMPFGLLSPDNAGAWSPLDPNSCEPLENYLVGFSNTPAKDIPLDMDWAEDILKKWTNVNDISQEDNSLTPRADTTHQPVTCKAADTSTSDDKEITGDLDRDLGLV